MNKEEDTSYMELKTGLQKIRRRRWFFWLVIMSYLPAMLFALKATQPGQAVGITFASWIFFLTAAVVLVALARCPQCGNCFHMSGFLFRPVRKCFHCSLHLTADKKANPSIREQ